MNVIFIAIRVYSIKAHIGTAVSKYLYIILTKYTWIFIVLSAVFYNF